MIASLAYSLLCNVVCCLCSPLLSLVVGSTKCVVPRSQNSLQLLCKVESDGKK